MKLFTKAKAVFASQPKSSSLESLQLVESRDPELSETLFNTNDLPYRSRQEQQILYSLRIILRVSSWLISLTIIGLLAHTLWVYNVTKDMTLVYPHGTIIEAWPSRGINILPTCLMLSAAGMAALLNFTALISLFGLLKFQKIRLNSPGPIAAGTSLFIGTGLWIAAVVYFKVWDMEKRSQGGLWSWACTHLEYELKAEKKIVGFGLICREMNYTFYAGATIAALEFLNLVILSWNLLAARRDESRARKISTKRRYQRLDVAV